LVRSAATAVGDAQVFDVDFADDLADLPEDLFAANRPQAKTHVHQTQHVEVSRLSIQLRYSSSLPPHRSTDHRAHGTTGDAGDVVTASFDLFDDADMGIAPGATGAQYQCDTLLHQASSRRLHNAPIGGGLQSSGSFGPQARRFSLRRDHRRYALVTAYSGRQGTFPAPERLTCTTVYLF
jgi:hypothetical protein